MSTGDEQAGHGRRRCECELKGLDMHNLMTLAFLENIGVPELLIILVIALLVFGNRLPDTARSLGRAIKEFKAGVAEGQKKPEEPEKKTEA